jgi:hypothetical protein
MLHTLKRHSLPMVTHFDHSLVLTYAFPNHQPPPPPDRRTPRFVRQARGDHPTPNAQTRRQLGTHRGYGGGSRLAPKARDPALGG